MNLRKGAAAVAISILAGPALAEAVLPIHGAFGNEAGCTFFMTGDMTDDSLAVITPDTFTSFATGCYFETLVSREAGEVFELNAACHSEGEDGSFAERLRVVDRGRDGVFVALGKLGDWGPLFRCPGTEGLFETPGVPV